MAPLGIAQRRATAPNLERILRRARAAQSADRYAEAAQTYAEATGVDPAIPELWANRGLMEHLAGSPAQAIASFQRALALNPTLFTAILFTGTDYIALGKPELALRFLKQALVLQPSNPDVSMALGKAYTAMHNPRRAADAYQDVVALRPEDSAAWYGIGTSCLSLIEQDGGKLAEHYASLPWSHALYADEMLVQGRTSEAVDAYKEVAASSTVFERQVFVAVLLQMRSVSATQEEPPVLPSSITQVLAIVQPSTEQNSDICQAPAPTNHASPNLGSRPVRLQMVCSYMSKDGTFVASLAAKRLTINPEDPEALYWSVKANEQRAVAALAQFESLSPHSPATYDMVGDLYRRRLQPDSALGQYAKALATDPHDVPALLGSAAAYLSIGDPVKTIEAAGSALVDMPNDARLNLLMAEALVNLRRYDDARSYLNRCIDSANNNHTVDSGSAELAPRAHALLGRVEAEVGNIPEAVAEITLGLSSDQDGSLYFQLSRLYRRQGKTAEAQQAIDHAKALIAQRRNRAATALQGSLEQSN